jgi:hypothetical protein
MVSGADGDRKPGLDRMTGAKASKVECPYVSSEETILREIEVLERYEFAESLGKNLR